MKHDQVAPRPFRIRLFCETVLGILTAAVAVLLITQIADIYYSASGEDIYTREIVAQRLKTLVIPALVWLIAAIGCYSFSTVVPDVKKTSPVPKSTLVRRLRPRALRKGADLPDDQRRLRHYGRLHFVCYTLATISSVLAAILTVVYLTRTGNFVSGSINADILAMTRHILPPIAVSFLLVIGAIVCEAVTAPKELACIRKILASGTGKEDIPFKTSRFDRIRNALDGNSGKLLLGIRLTLLAIAAALIIAGILNSGTRDVLYKAVNICTECIGLG